MTKLNGYNFEILYFTKDDTYISGTGWQLNKNLIASRLKILGTSDTDNMYKVIPSNTSYLRLKVVKQSSSNDISVSDISDLEIYLHTINNPINNPESVIISFQSSYEDSYFEECIDNGGLYFKIPGDIYIRGEISITLHDSVYDKFNKVTSPNQISNCIYIPHNNILYYNISDSELYIEPINTFDYRNENYIQFFVVAKDMSNDVSICDGIIGGRGKYFYDEWKNKYTIYFLNQKFNNDYDNMNIIDNLKFYRKSASFINNKLSIFSTGNRLLSERINITRLTSIDITVPEGYKALFLACKDNDDFVLTTNWLTASYIHIVVSGRNYKTTFGDKIYVLCPFQAKYGYILLAKNDDSTINLDEKSNYSISIVKNTNRIKTNSYIFVPSENNIENIYFETAPYGIYFKLPGKLYLRGIHTDEVTNVMESLSDIYGYSSSPKGVDGYIYMPHNSILYYNLENSSIAIHNGSGDNTNLFTYDYTNPSYVILFTIGKLFDHDDILNGELKYIYDEYKLYHNKYDKYKNLLPITSYNYEWEIGSLIIGADQIMIVLQIVYV